MLAPRADGAQKQLTMLWVIGQELTRLCLTPRICISSEHIDGTDGSIENRKGRTPGGGGGLLASMIEAKSAATSRLSRRASLCVPVSRSGSEGTMRDDAGGCVALAVDCQSVRVH